MTHPFPVKVVALQAGVSVATVDRVIKQRGGVHAGTVRRVMQALDELARQSTQVGLSGRKFMLDVLMVAPRRFTDAVRAALEAELPSLQPAVLRSRFHLHETLAAEGTGLAGGGGSGEPAGGGRHSRRDPGDGFTRFRAPQLRGHG